MPTTLTVAGKAVTRGHVLVPRTGAWHGTVWLDADTAPTGAASLVWGDNEATWSATVVRGGVLAEGGPAEVRIVGGGGGLGAALPGASYRNVSPRTLLGQILPAAGERLSGTSPAATLDAILARWSRAAGPCGQQVSRLTEAIGALWRVLPDGSVYVGPETRGAITLPAHTQVTGRLPDLGRVTLASATPWAFLPGQTLDGVRVDQIVLRISDREVRTELWLALPTCSARWSSAWYSRAWTRLRSTTPRSRR